MHIQLSKLIWKAFANAHEIVFVRRINCGPCLFPDWRNSWVSLLCSILTLDVNDIGNHFRKHSLHPPALEVCAARRLWILRLSVYTSRMQRKFQLPILLHQNTTLSASDVQLLVSGHITCSPSPPLCLSVSLFIFSQTLSDMRWPLRHSKINPSAAAVLCQLQYSMVDWKGTIVRWY